MNLFEVPGISLDGAISILYGDAAPGNTVPTDIAPQGSVYFRTDGTTYKKTSPGLGADAWSLESGSGGGGNSQTIRTLLNATGKTLVDAVGCLGQATVVWCLTVEAVGSSENRCTMMLAATHNGNSATGTGLPTKVRYNISGVLKFGEIAGLRAEAELSADKTNVTLHVTASEAFHVQAYRMVGAGALATPPAGGSGGSGGTADPYQLPMASKTVLGGVKVGDNLTITPEGVLHATAPGYGNTAHSLFDNTFIFAGEVLPAIADGAVYPFFNSTVVAARASVSGAPATDTTFRLIKNGVRTGPDITILAGDLSSPVVTMAVPAALTDSLTVEVVTGSGAMDAYVSLMFNADMRLQDPVNVLSPVEELVFPHYAALADARSSVLAKWYPAAPVVLRQAFVVMRDVSGAPVRVSVLLNGVSITPDIVVPGGSDKSPTVDLGSVPMGVTDKLEFKLLSGAFGEDLTVTLVYQPAGV